MNTEIQDHESVQDEPQSFEPTGSDDPGRSTATIEHKAGETDVSDFTHIEKRDAKIDVVRVWYDDKSTTNYVDYYRATITSVSP